MINQWKSYDYLKKEQEIKLRKIIKFCYENVPYYKNLFNSLNLLPSDFKSLEDLQKLPILTKEIIKKEWDTFKPINLSKMIYYNRATGGSTGTPLSYRLLKSDRFLMGAMLYRGWSYGNYNLGDKMVILAGSSLDVGKKPHFQTIIEDRLLNTRKLSSFDMGERELHQYVKIINSFKPKFLRGYASSLYFFSKWIEQNDISIHTPESIFTTAERLFPHMRKKITDIFNCEVFDGYGLNDGGVSAYECKEHAGLHIDTERSIMEVVDDRGEQLDRGEGRILATSLHNYAMPFIRYDTGDLGHIIDDKCACGRGYVLLKEIIGREQEMLLTPEGKFIHGEFITHIFWEVPHVKKFQVVQKSKENLDIFIVPEQGFEMENLNHIESLIKNRSKEWNLKFQFVDTINQTEAGKYKFVINKIKNE